MRLPSDIRVLVVEDDARLRELVNVVLEKAGFVTGLAETGEAALALARAERPAAVVADVHLPGMSGYEVCHTLRGELGDGLGFVLVSGCRTESFDRVAGLLLGADDYLVKPFQPDELVARVRAVLRRTSDHDPIRRSGLTPREREVLGLLAAGLDQASIASQLGITAKTVGTHIEHILGKLQVNSRAQAVAAAFRDGLLATS